MIAAVAIAIAVVDNTFAIAHGTIHSNNKEVYEDIFHCKCVVHKANNSAASSSFAAVVGSSISDSKFHAYVVELSEDEKISYQSLPLTWTKANEKLGKGVVNGVSKALQWFGIYNLLLCLQILDTSHQLMK